MKKRTVGLVLPIVFLALGAILPVRAQGAEEGKPPEYTYVAEWAVPRAQWRDMAKVNADEGVMMEKLLAEGVITAYGDFSSLLHQEGQPTHGSWFSAKSVGNLLKALEAIYTLPDVTFPVLAASKHWDYFMVSNHHGTRPGSYKGGYLSGSGFDVKPGHRSEFEELLKNHLVPVFEKLLAEGAVTFYSLDSELYHSEKPGRVTLVYTTADAAGMDKVEQAIDSAFEKNATFSAAFRAAAEMETHRDFLARVGTMSQK